MRLLFLLFLLVLAAPAWADGGSFKSSWYGGMLSLDRVSTHLVAKQYFENKGDTRGSWELPETKLGAAVNYKLNKWWVAEACGLHSTRTGRQEVGLSLRFCVGYLSGKPYR